MSEAEFWEATYATVAILYRIKALEWGQRRDFFTAQLIAMQASSKDHTYTAQEILQLQYPVLNDGVTVAIDPDHGAAGDWRVLKQSLKGHG